MHNYKTPSDRKGRFEPVSKKPSLTVPDMAMPMSEIMNRFLRGQELPIGGNTYYDSDKGEVDFNSVDPTRDPAFDLADYTALQNEIKQRQSEAKANKEQLIADSKNPQPSAESEGGAKKEVTERSGVDDVKANPEAKSQKVSGSE